MSVLVGGDPAGIKWNLLGPAISALTGRMPLKVSNIRLPVEEPETALAGAIARRVGVKSDDLTRWRILRKSLDARSPRDLQFVYSAVVDVPDEPQRFAQLR
ncbi:MAG TPA: hypothetical protein VG055_02095, partial [Planctomycetaceae bacterium]|nr:hypothetical protein [Planctomycetaceae bacterium]